MQNKIKPKFSVFLCITVMLFSLNGCMSAMLKLAQSQYKDYGVYDQSVQPDQMSVLRFGFVNIKSFNGNQVSWGDKANNQGFVKVPSGVNTIIFDWVMAETRLSSIDYNSMAGTMTYTYITTTSSLSDITFPNVKMLPGHKYLIGGGKGTDGQLRIHLLDQTYAPCGYFGDVVADPPKESKTPAKFDGKWENTYNETFEFAGNTWVQKIPPFTGSNTGPNEIRIRGTFTDDGGNITLYTIDTSIDGGSWLDISAMRQAYIWKYKLDGSSLQLELPYMMPKLSYIKQ